MFFALNMTWTHCEVYWDLDFEPLKRSGGQPVALGGGVRCLAWNFFLYSTTCDWFVVSGGRFRSHFWHLEVWALETGS